MSVTPEQSAAAMQGMAQFGQALAQGFLEFIGRQNDSLQAVTPGTAPGLTEAEWFSELQKDFAEKHARLWAQIAGSNSGEKAEPVVQPPPGDRRFASPEWSSSPVYDYIRQAYLVNAGFLTKLADSMPLADGRAKERIQFLTRQYVDAFSPSNFAATNPEFIQTALETKGESITRGIQNLIGDMEKGRISMTDDSAFEVGRNLAITPGAVIYENELIQLIQYAPLTEQVYERPLLIVPPCINK
ncbi:MAG: class I poly(R)-hydroxyalkanoic acid synthase, partial [Zoogloea sp.]|nr:class I poly(R)-hydroxyalkanoic acid synthase [Zoogloea sp.]